MSIVDDLLTEAQNGRLNDHLSQRFGLSPEQTQAAVAALTPALSTALNDALKDPAALARLIDAVTHQTHQTAFLDHDAAHSDESVELGRDAVAQLFGSPAAAGQIAQMAAGASGLRADLLAQLLPVLASVVFGGLFKSFASAGLGGLLTQLAGSGALTGILTELIAGRLSGAAAPSAPAPAPGGGFGGLLGGLLGALFGGARPPTPAPAPTPSLPGGLDPADLQSVFEQMKNRLQPANAAAPGFDPELQEAIDNVFGAARR
jgi:hypothetical protein